MLLFLSSHHHALLDAVATRRERIGAPDGWQANEGVEALNRCRGDPPYSPNSKQHGRVVRRLLALAEVAVEARRDEPRREVRAHQREVDAQAQTTVEVPAAVVPPRVLHEVRLDDPEGVREPGVEDRAQAARARAR